MVKSIYIYLSKQRGECQNHLYGILYDCKYEKMHHNKQEEK